MPDKLGTPDLEGPVAPRLATIDAELLPAVMHFARQVAHGLGPRGRTAEHLDAAVGTVYRSVDHTFDSEEGQYDSEQRS